jgi:curved DNA-binding protein CbpA
MAPDASAYAALGLEPNADWAAVERAYKSLIKQHHPDRAGGDPARASEINRAYRELRSEFRSRDELVLDDGQELARGGKAWPRAAFVIAAAVVLLLVGTGPILTFVNGLAASSEPAPYGEPRAKRIAAEADPMDAPLHLSAVDQAIGDAVHIARTRDEYALANRSRDCHRELRADPTIARFDSCAAFDDAVIEVQDRDPLRDQGPFSELAVTGRQMSSATSLSNDYLAIDGRLDRIRLRVELALAPAPPPPPPAASNEAVGD